MIKCDTCPRCKDKYPGNLDSNGYHFHICGMSGNIVYTMPHKVKRLSGRGYIHYGISSCGLYETIEDALKSMTESERRRWEQEKNRRASEDGTDHNGHQV